MVFVTRMLHVSTTWVAFNAHVNLVTLAMETHLVLVSPHPYCILKVSVLLMTWIHCGRAPSCCGCKHYGCSVIADVDECSNSSLNNCDSNAECRNTIGSYQCSCLQGFMGNGTYCSGMFQPSICGGFITLLLHGCFSDIDECESSPCSVHADCRNTEGSYYCSCHPGYSGNGFICDGMHRC